MISFFEQKKDNKTIKKIINYFVNDTWVNGSITNEFEKKLKSFLKIDHNTITCNSGSDALLISLILNKNKERNIYLTTPISYIASASIPKFLNLELIYIDVKKDNFIMCIDALEDFLKNCPKKIKKRINGIINVELFGQTCDLVKLKKISSKYNLTLIGDCAQSLGTKFNNKSTINYYNYAITSFYPTKILSCYGDGGAIFFKENYSDVVLLKNNGHSLLDKSLCLKIGINSRLDSIQALVLNEKIHELKKIILKKKNIFHLYNKLIKENSLFSLPKDFNSSVKSNNYIYPLFINKNYRLRFLNYMKKNHIECKLFYKKLLPDNNVLKPIFKTNLKNSIKCSKELICLPSHENLKKKEIIKIANLINTLKF